MIIDASSSHPLCEEEKVVCLVGTPTAVAKALRAMGLAPSMGSVLAPPVEAVFESIFAVTCLFLHR